MRIYLDLCCFNRPYDDQSQTRIRLETEAKVVLQQKIQDGECELLWSSVLDFECANNPYEEHRLAISQWRWLAVGISMADNRALGLARQFTEAGIGTYDAIHAASAVVGGADIFVTTDDRLLTRLRRANRIVSMLPQEALAFVENWYEN